ncbi:mechanosensitive ion channel family protein [Porifericola rhodea]|uniref:mechanosensitive ion channel family protein n=1 Tax=Porifericola rhodea TaxID=930972 RepID=UPI0026652322|nr:mechanosensitive ion channel family protein [Porifericola rhodea]WKN30681.1 mechanosensitive ion channel family protein [Porifericola rhodea]
MNSRTRIFFPLLVFLFAQPLITFPDETSDLILYKITQATVILSFGWVLLRMVRVVEDVVFEHYTVHRHNTFKSRRIRTQLQFIRRILVVVIFILVLSAILLTFREVRDIGATLLTSAGVAGIIIGFAAQKSIANLLAGLQIAITQPIKIDDSVIVENEWGIIEEITLTYVVVKIWDKRRIVLPINYFIEKPFQNWTRTSSELLGPIVLYLDYNIPVDALRRELNDILQSEKLWDGKVNVIQVVDTTEKCMVLRILVSAENAPDAWDLRCIVREKLITFVRENYPEALPMQRLYMMDHSSVNPKEKSIEIEERVTH